MRSDQVAREARAAALINAVAHCGQRGAHLHRKTGTKMFKPCQPARNSDHGRLLLIEVLPVGSRGRATTKAQAKFIERCVSRRSRLWQKAFLQNSMAAQSGLLPGSSINSWTL